MFSINPIFSIFCKNWLRSGSDLFIRIEIRQNNSDPYGSRSEHWRKVDYSWSGRKATGYLFFTDDHEYPPSTQENTLQYALGSWETGVDFNLEVL